MAYHRRIARCRADARGSSRSRPSSTRPSEVSKPIFSRTSSGAYGLAFVVLFAFTAWGIAQTKRAAQRVEYLREEVPRGAPRASSRRGFVIASRTPAGNSLSVVTPSPYRSRVTREAVCIASGQLVQSRRPFGFGVARAAHGSAGPFDPGCFSSR